MKAFLRDSTCDYPKLAKKFRDFYETLIELNEQSQQSLLVSIRLHYTLETGYEEQFDEKINKYISEKKLERVKYLDDS